jgi:hypothetical protein
MSLVRQGNIQTGTMILNIPSTFYLLYVCGADGLHIVLVSGSILAAPNAVNSDIQELSERPFC